MIVVPLIERKRDGDALSPHEWRRVIEAYTRGTVPDYQMAALLMAVALNGLDDMELSAVTDAMWESGGRLAFGSGTPPRVDKHSTGGVGDKVSLILAPLVASTGVAVPMISGRGLGHTGGTLDKLRAIPGFRVWLSLEDAQRQVERIGAVLIGQTDEIAPADQKLYALRDATATVDSIPLMAASIMSKKLAEDLHGLVLDIKTGSGAFLPDAEDALDLAETMVQLGEDRDCPTVALVSAMDRPLGSACGNALEVAESIAALRGDGPADLMELVLRLGAEMLVLAGAEQRLDAARGALQERLSSGDALEKFREIVRAQGGAVGVLDDPSLLPGAPVSETYESAAEGLVIMVEPRTIGEAIVAMGGGRQSMEDEVDVAVGFEIHVKPGDPVVYGQPIATIHARDDAGAAVGRAALDTAIAIGPVSQVTSLPLVSHRVTVNGVEAS
ncbi:MAG: thymidine phosphorylase [Gemmatimonadales bacterium]|jgi:pyrimidine-nucleoside phosphorylase